MGWGWIEKGGGVKKEQRGLKEGEDRLRGGVEQKEELIGWGWIERGCRDRVGDGLKESGGVGREGKGLKGGADGLGWVESEGSG